jgi:hypothetical protein
MPTTSSSNPELRGLEAPLKHLLCNLADVRQRLSDIVQQDGPADVIVATERALTTVERALTQVTAVGTALEQHRGR